jgi:plasmid stability protein
LRQPATCSGDHFSWSFASAIAASPMVVAKCYRTGMAVNMHIRDLDEPTHRELVRRANAAGMSLRSYVIEVLHRHAALPTLEEWLDEVRADPPLPSEGPDSVTLVEEGRRDIDVA